MPKFFDKTGMVFDQLTVIKYLGKRTDKKGYSKGSLFECVCSCGNVVTRPSSNLRVHDSHGTNCGACKVSNHKKKEGEVFKSKNYGDFIVLEYKTAKEVVVKFLKTSYVTTAAIKDLESGAIKDPYYPAVYGVGYCGVGPYPLSYYKHGKQTNTPAYEAWLIRLKSCYGESKSSHLYVGASVCDDWHNFQNFAKWYYQQVKLYGKGGSVDKDLLHLGNKYYSPETARYVPSAINSLFTGASGKTAGIHFCNNKKKYVAQIQRGELTASGKKKQSYLGTFNTYSEAEQVYIAAKIAHVRGTSLKYQEQLPPDLFYKLYTGAENYVDYYMNHK
jgi:hypothetical protein